MARHGLHKNTLGQSSSAFPLLTENSLKFICPILERSQAIICVSHRIYGVPEWKIRCPSPTCGLDRSHEESGKAFLRNLSSDESIGMVLTYEAGPVFRKTTANVMKMLKARGPRRAYLSLGRSLGLPSHSHSMSRTILTRHCPTWFRSF